MTTRTEKRLAWIRRECEHLLGLSALAYPGEPFGEVSARLLGREALAPDDLPPVERGELAARLRRELNEAAGRDAGRREAAERGQSPEEVTRQGEEWLR